MKINRLREFILLFVLILGFSTVYAEEIDYTGYDKYLTKLDVESEYKGISKDNSIILLQVDRLTNAYINKKYNDVEILPNINKLLKEEKGTFYFDNFYETSLPASNESEFSVLNSLYPHPNTDSLERNLSKKTRELPKILAEEGYNTKYLFANKLYSPKKIEIAKSQGFKDIYYFGSYNEKLFDRIMSSVEENKNFIYALTDSSSYYEANDDFKLQEKNDFASDILYLNYMDKKIGELLNLIEEKNKNVTLLIYGGNGRPVFNSTDSKGEINNTIKSLNVPFIVRTNSSVKSKVFNHRSSEIDVMPSILHLIGLNKNTYPMMGQVLFNPNLEKRDLYFQNKLSKGSFLSDNILFVVNKINIKYQAFDLAENKAIDPKEYLTKSQNAISQIDFSNGLCDLDIMEELLLNYRKKQKMSLPSDKSIMHAGGEIAGLGYSNMQDALDHNYKNGKRFFEIDFEKTTDGRYVCIHSWDGFLKKFFDIDPVKGQKNKYIPFSYKDFMNFKEVHGYKQMDVKDVTNWLNTHKDAYIITDCKGDNKELIQEIINSGFKDLDRIIIQIYKANEYDYVYNKGFKNIIYTLYRRDVSDQTVIDFAKNKKIFAITMNEEKYKTGIGKKLIDNKINVFVHTINYLEDANKLLNQGVKMIYTDTL